MTTPGFRTHMRAGWIARLASLVIAAVALGSLLALVGVADRDSGTRAVARTRQAAGVDPGGAPGNVPHVMSVPRSFLGLSAEYWAMPMFERHILLFDRVLSLLHAPGTGPFVLRIGGDSADQAVWDLHLRRIPREIVDLTPSWFGRTSALVRAAGARLILDLNLITDLPSMAAQWARAAVTELPRGSIVGFEIGNEPDLYDAGFWSRMYVPLRRVLGLILPGEFAPRNYVDVFGSYARALATFAPGIPLVGPAVANPARDLGWIASLLAAPHPGLELVSGHRYPYSACVHNPLRPTYPTIPRLLSERATAGMARQLEPAIRLAHNAGLPFRLTELNSVTCGGLPGVSDTFATALWAPDALFELLRAGVDGVNIHVRPDLVNGAFGLARHGLAARPLLYGLILFARMLGPDAQLVGVHADANRPQHLKVWAVRVGGDRLRVLLINKGGHPVRVALQLPAIGLATVQRLLAPSVTARSGVTLDGRQLGVEGTWRGRAANETIASGARGYELTIGRTSAALVEVRLRPGGLRSAAFTHVGRQQAGQG
jgi:hypothetical protein